MLGRSHAFLRRTSPPTVLQIRSRNSFGASQGQSRELRVLLARSMPISARRLKESTPWFNTICFQHSSADNEHHEATNSPVDPENVETDFLSQVQHSFCEEIFPKVLPDHQRSVTIHGDPIILVVSVSGGCDSMGLLHSILDLTTRVDTDGDCGEKDQQHKRQHVRRFTCSSNQDSTAYDCSLHVVHFDHRQRGVESDQDRLFVQNVCRSLDIPCHVERWQDDKDGAIPFSQDTARNWRKSVLMHQFHLIASTTTQHTDSSSTQQQNSGMILTAHHLDDSEESFLLKFIRGVHITNLAGIERIQRMEDGITWARPFIHISKEQIQDYLLARGLAWREDASNQSNKYLRNRVRNELVPLLRDMMGGEDALRSRLSNLSRQSQELKNDLSSRTSEYWKNNQSDHHGRFLLPEKSTELDLVTKHAIFQWVQSQTGGHQLTFEHLGRVCAQITDYPQNRKWSLPIGQDWRVYRNGDSLSLSNPAHDKENKTDKEIGQVSDTLLTWSEVDQHGGPEQNTKHCVLLRITLENVIRQQLVTRDYITVLSSMDLFLSTAAEKNTWRFTPSWRKGHSPPKLKDFLRGQKVPLHMRDDIPVVYMKHEGEKVLVAVFVRDRWVLNSLFAPIDNDASTNEKVLQIQLDDID